MSGNPFDREVFNARERPLSSDQNAIAAYADLALREYLLRTRAQRNDLADDSILVVPRVGQAAFVGSAFKVRQIGSGTGMQVGLDAGLGFFNDNTPASSVGGVVGVDDLSAIKPLSLTAQELINVPAADATNPRIDIIEIAVDRRLTDATSRDVLNATTGVATPASVSKTLTYNQNGRSTVNGSGSINYKTGTPAGTPTVPATDAGYIKIAEIDVAATVTGINTTNIRDFRLMWSIDGRLPFSFRVLVPRIAAVGFPGGQFKLLRMNTPPGVLIGINTGIAIVGVYPPPPAGINNMIGPATVYVIAGGMTGPLDVNIDAAWQNAGQPGVSGAGVGGTATLEALIPTVSDSGVLPVPGASVFVLGPTGMNPGFLTGLRQPAIAFSMAMRSLGVSAAGTYSPTMIGYDVRGLIPT